MTPTVDTSANTPKDCRLCPRLAGYRDENEKENPDWFNGAVPCFGADDAKLLIVGLAPGGVLDGPFKCRPKAIPAARA